MIVRFITVFVEGQATLAEAAQHVSAANGIDVELVDARLESLMASSAGDWRRRVGGSLAPGALVLLLHGLLPDERRALAIADCAARIADEETVVFLAPGCIVRRVPERLIAHAKRHGAAVPMLGDLPPWDGLEPSYSSPSPESPALAGILAVTSHVAPEWKAVRDEQLEVSRHRAPGVALDRVLRYGAYRPTTLGWDLGVVDPARLSDGVDLDDDADVITLEGFDEMQPWVPDARLMNPRVTTWNRPVLREVLDRFACEIERRRTQIDDPASPDEPLRLLSRYVALEGETLAYPSDDSREALVSWLRQAVAADGQRVSRALYLAWKLRPDVQAAYPNPLDADAKKLQRDWGPHAVAEGMLDDDLLSPIPREVVRRQATEPGVVVTGYLDRMLGLGGVAREILAASEQVGIPVSERLLTGSLSPEVGSSGDRGPLREVSISVLGVGSGDWWSFNERPEVQAANRRIGVLYWEADCPIPGIDDVARSLDEIWVASDFVRHIVERQVGIPVRVMPTPFRITPPSACDISALVSQLDGRRYFVFAFDYQSTVQRKNPLGAVEAFRSAFSADDDVCLILKSVNGNRKRRDRAMLERHVEGMTDVVTIDGPWDWGDLSRLLANATGYVSLHRSEGFGLTIAEAMGLGVPTIASAYGGNLQFSDSTTSMLVSGGSSRIGEGADPYPADAEWFEPSPHQAAEYMRRIVDGSDDVSSMVEAAHARVTEELSRDRLVEFLRREI